MPRTQPRRMKTEYLDMAPENSVFWCFPNFAEHWNCLRTFKKYTDAWFPLPDFLMRLVQGTTEHLDL
jgi:hypothetical protein